MLNVTRWKPAADALRRRDGATRSLRCLARDAVVASICGFVVVFMVGASYAAVPSTTGSAAPPVSTAPPGRDLGAVGAPLARKIAVRFDANVGPGLPWKFERAE
jgi:cytochrome c oxidase assembly protein subunit 11